jgi:hypothetical protein
VMVGWVMWSGLYMECSCMVDNMAEGISGNWTSILNGS